jgi:monoamine oxidase
MALTRRNLLERIGAVGGAGAAYMAMEALGLAIPTAAGAENFELPRASGSGKSVVILGAGIAGLISAYELQRAGYRVTVLEANNRIGGRAWTIRGGDRIVQTGRPDQNASFDEGLYFNAGAARIPSTHRVILGYARRFGVPMEVFVNTNRNAGWDFGGKVYDERRMVSDMRGRMSELLAKAIDQGALDQAVPKDELATIRRLLAPYGSLNPQGQYAPRGSNGYSVEPGGYAQAPVPLAPLSWDELLAATPNSPVPYIFDNIWDMQPTMFQPVGGMDRIAHAIYEQVKPAVRMNAPVTAIRRSANGVRIEHGEAVTDADYCVCTLPAPLLSAIPNDFSAAKKAALSGIPYLHSVKVGFEAPRFWESDSHVFGGVAWTDRLNENLLYPSGGFNQPKGVLVAAYVAGWTRPENPEAFSVLPFADRFRICRESVEALHPGKSHLLAKPVTVSWGQTPWESGVGVQWNDGGPRGKIDRGARYAELLKPEGNIVFAGEHLSYQGQWQEGAALSAHEALKVLRAMAAELPAKAAAR